MHFLFASAALLALLKPHPVASLAVDASIKAVTLDIVNKNLAPDGFLRSTIVANGQYPGPAITATKGQTLRVTVNNKLTDPNMRRSTTVNFDGIFQSTANSYNEGSAFVTTCPIAPGASYTYEVPLGSQTGTHWYHSELSVQYVDGLRGALIIYDPLDPQRQLYDVDDLSTVIQLGDWWQNSSLPMLARYEATGIVPVSDSGTVNGIGRYQGGPNVPFAVTNVVSGKRYRLRVINQSARNVFTFSVDSHSLTVIEADGVATRPHTVDVIEMLAGQRYSVVLTANKPVANYWINAPFVGGLPSRNLHQNATLSRSILRYRGAPIAEPTTPWTLGPENGVPLIEANLVPLVNEVPPPADVNISLDLTVIAGQAIWNVNNISYLPPKVPTLNKVLAGSASFDPTENTFILPAHKTIQIEFPPTDDDDAHRMCFIASPFLSIDLDTISTAFHLHGGNFWVVKSMSSSTANFVNPIRRDVAGVGGSGTTIRFRTDNPGPWLFHCHIFWHKQAGLATVMLADPAAVRKNTHPTKAWEALCPAYNALPVELQ
ncbi:Laccase-2 [Hypsizygus marmoreus]|uniref:Laccase-2 n=1 Tax=Hypsizygus marmoreus TaxID=39966 RepID=A0A369JVE2_HYPMA|nr:Laccase-2 [Hypsizygus marmoreus]